MRTLELALPQRVVFEVGCLAEAGSIAAALGSRALVVTGANVERAAGLEDFLRSAGLAVATFREIGEPTVQTVREGVAAARTEGCDLVVGFGGGSPMDAAKAIAALLGCGGDPLDYLEIVGAGQPLKGEGVPCIAIPTTAGTGAEVTRNAVLGSPQHGVKASLRGPQVLPRVAIVDPECTRGLPRDVTAYSGMDALTQLLEAFTSWRASPLTDPYCRDGLERAALSLRAALEDRLDGRVNMSLAALFGGMALANAGLGAVHGIAGPLGGMCDAPHGAVCARLVPFVVDANVRALMDRRPESVAVERYAEAAAILTGRADATADDLAPWLRGLIDELAIPPLSGWGLRPDQHAELVNKAHAASSMKANPITLTEKEIAATIAAAA